MDGSRLLHQKLVPSSEYLPFSFTLTVCVLAILTVLMLTSPQSDQYVQLDVITFKGDLAIYSELGRLDHAPK
jgi:hypothetical protein